MSFEHQWLCVISMTDARVDCELPACDRNRELWQECNVL
jgi:hypothetical protein